MAKNNTKARDDAAEAETSAPADRQLQSLGDVGIEENRRAEEAAIEAELEQEEAARAAKLRTMSARDIRIADMRSKADAMGGYDVYEVNPDQEHNVVLRTQCFRPGDLLLATPEEAAFDVAAKRLRGV